MTCNASVPRHRANFSSHRANFSRLGLNLFRHAPALRSWKSSRFGSFARQGIEIVLTAHPTQINRRALQYKHLQIVHLLEYNRADLCHEERELLIEYLRREVTSLWQTDELRHHKPTPVDEARAGLHIVEQSL